MFLRNTVVFTTFSQLVPAASRIAERFLSTCSVCASMPPWIRFPVAGSSATWPEMKTNPFALIACEYGPIALGALGVETTSRVKPLMDPLFCHPDPAKRERDLYCHQTLSDQLKYPREYRQQHSTVYSRFSYLIGFPL